MVLGTVLNSLGRIPMILVISGRIFCDSGQYSCDFGQDSYDFCDFGQDFGDSSGVFVTLVILVRILVISGQDVDHGF